MPAPAKDIFEKMFKTGKTPDEIIDELGLKQVTDPTVIQEAIAKAINENPKQLEQYCGGREALFGFFVGQVMKTTQGKANPQMLNQLLKQALSEKCKQL